MSNKRNTETDTLFKAILSLETVDELYNFFEDACTIREIKDIAQRFQVARLLNSGCNYQEVTAETGASTATICRVNKCLNYGEGGYLTAIERLNQEGNNTDDK